jgi:DNA mismatch repair protein MutS
MVLILKSLFVIKYLNSLLHFTLIKKYKLASKDKEVKETPLMKQYNEIKRSPDACLFRVGDFTKHSEKMLSGLQNIGITLTKRGAGSATETALAGFPHHSINTYLPKLVGGTSCSHL